MPESPVSRWVGGDLQHVVSAVRPVVLTGFTLMAPAAPTEWIVLGALYVALAMALGEYGRRSPGTRLAVLVTFSAADVVWLLVAVGRFGLLTASTPILAGIGIGLTVLLLVRTTGMAASMLGTTIYYSAALIYCGAMFGRLGPETGAYLAAAVAIAGGLVGYIGDEARRTAAARSAHDGLRILSIASSDIEATGSEPGILSVVARYASRLAGAERVWVMQADATEGALRLAAQVGMPEELVRAAEPSEAGLSRVVYETGEGLILPQPANRDPRLSQWERSLVHRHLAAVPITDARGVRAVIMATRDAGKPGFHEDDLYLLLMLATIVSNKLRTARSVRAMRAAATKDALTGVCNQGALAKLLEQQVRRSGIAAERLSLLILDMDHFKALNDAVGHYTGNQVLKAVAGKLREACRVTDVVARCGGDEFAVVMPATEAADARHVAQRIATKLAEIKSEMRLPAPTTASMGVATFPSDGPNDVALFRCADARMYGAKRGRNAAAQQLAESSVQPETPLVGTLPLA